MSSPAAHTPWSDRFEELGKPNGSKYWFEADVMAAFDYRTPASWKQVVNKALQACITLDIPIDQTFIQLPDGSRKLTRFACYLVAMNADPKKPQVAAAQLYLATLAESFQRLVDHQEGVERVLIRSEVSDGQKALMSTAKAHGVVTYSFFQNAGYLGMYNMNFKRLEQFKALPEGQKLMDHMGKTELAANLFRITQTDEKIKNDGVHGQSALERVATEVGRKVRNTMIELSGTAPEHLPLAEPIQSVKKALKGADKRFRRIDSGGKKKAST